MRTVINIDVPELTPAIDFYRDALGLRLSRIIDGDVAELTGTSSVIYLLENAAGSPASIPAAPGENVMSRQYSRHWTPVHIDFVVEDLDSAAERAKNAGATQESACIEWKGSRCITFSDPFGHGFCLIEFIRGTYQ